MAEVFSSLFLGMGIQKKIELNSVVHLFLSKVSNGEHLTEISISVRAARARLYFLNPRGGSNIITLFSSEVYLVFLNQLNDNHWSAITATWFSFQDTSVTALTICVALC